MKLYKTELEIGFKHKEFLVESDTLDLKNFLEGIRCVLSSDKISSGYKIYGFVDTLASLKCDRCLVIFENEFQVKIDVILSNNNELIKESSSDVLRFLDSDDFIDLTSILRESIIIELPIKKLCKDECKGLCASCGVDLNNNSCCCKKSQSTNQLSELKQLMK